MSASASNTVPQYSQLEPVIGAPQFGHLHIALASVMIHGVAPC